MTRFDTLPLKPAIQENLKQLGFTQMTPIQTKSLPVTLEGKDIVAKAQTGSGKTIAFGLPILQKLDIASYNPQALILCPTRELADQVAEVLRKLARFAQNIKVLTLCGGVPMRGQIESLKSGAHILVGTPGRIGDHIGKHTIDLKHIKTVVLDEADRMLDMGFMDAVSHILSHVPTNRHTMLFSATFEAKVQKLGSSMMKNAVFVEVEGEALQIKERFFVCKSGEKEQTLMKLLKHFNPKNTIIFCNTKITVAELSDQLWDAGFSILDLHGDLDQRDRTETLLQFANDSCRILVATDVAARGLDIKGVDMVVNFDLPQKPDIYTHRIGRTGRAGESGLAVTIITSHERGKLGNIVSEVTLEEAASLEDKTIDLQASMRTLCILGGKKDKLRAGDIVGVLCVGVGLDKEALGKIDLFDKTSYVAIKAENFEKAFKGLQKTKIKKRNYKVITIG